ncbi:MAG TPA: DUF433 domain-containing protein [Streptosporangiaceae bacterium]
MVRPGDVIRDTHYITPLYRKAEAARIIAVPATTFRNWSVGYAYKRLDGSEVVSQPIVTTAQPATPHGLSVPFVGLAEAYIVAAFKEAGVPMRRIRPAVLWLQQHIGLDQALASERLKTDGAEVLWDYGHQTGDEADRQLVEGLVVVRKGGQQVFRPVVSNYLQRVTYENGWTRVIELPKCRDIRVVVDPWLNGGQPTLAARGIRIADIVNRLAAGEDAVDVADDYDLPRRQIELLRRVA